MESILTRRPAGRRGRRDEVTEYRELKKGEIIQEGDEVDSSAGWNDEPRWVPARAIGEKAPDPSYPAHRIYRRKVVTAAQPDGAENAQ